MLVLSRRVGQRLLIGEDIVLQVTHIGPESVRIAIDAPRDVKVLREELKPHEEPDKP